MIGAVDCWNDCRSRLRDLVTPARYDAFLHALVPLSSAPDSLQLLAPNAALRDWVAKNYMEHIQEALAQAGAASISVQLGILGYDEPGHQEPLKAPVSSRGRERDTPILLRPEFSFQNFVEGASNRLAKATAQRVAHRPGDNQHNPLVICGGVGLGKTHLMQAVGNALRGDSTDHDFRIVYCSTESFVNEMVRAIRSHEMAEFKHHYRTPDVLLMDDIQFLAGKERCQEEVFYTINALHEQGCQLIATCDRYPREVDGLQGRLKSRFGWGITVVVEPPDMETRAAILMRKAEGREPQLTAAAAMLIAQRINSNVRELEGALNRLYAYVEFSGQQAIDDDTVRLALLDLFALHQRRIGPEEIKQAVAGYYKLRVSQLESSQRERRIVRPRHIAMALCKELTPGSLPEIGHAFGGRDHSTVIYACRRIEQLRQAEAQLNSDYEYLLRELTT